MNANGRAKENPTALPRVSVALCTYNGERYLRAQLDSLLAQTGCELDIVAIDDASTDATADILRSYAAGDARFRVLVNERNVGHIENFRRALSLCDGEYICPCDQDDVWAPEKTRALLAALGEADLVYCDSEMIDQYGRPLHRRLSDDRRMYEGKNPLALLLYNSVSGHAALIRKGLLAQALPFPQKIFHDWWLALAAASNRGINYLPEPLVAFRRHAETATAMGNIRDSAARASAREQLEYQQLIIRGAARFPSAQGPTLQAMDHALSDWLDHGRGYRYNALLWRHRKVLHTIKKLAFPRILKIIEKQLLWMYRMSKGER
jgi:glycosyltransferase involved in cell wall biosynthesis